MTSNGSSYSRGAPPHTAPCGALPIMLAMQDRIFVVSRLELRAAWIPPLTLGIALMVGGTLLNSMLARPQTITSAADRSARLKIDTDPGSGSLSLHLSCALAYDIAFETRVGRVSQHRALLWLPASAGRIDAWVLSPKGGSHEN